MHFEYPLPWEHRDYDVFDALLGYMDREGGEVGLDVLDYALNHLVESRTNPDRAPMLGAILQDGGSAWEVTPAADEGNFVLTRRELGPVAEAIDGLAPASERAAAHLRTAWKELAGRAPSPDQAYFHALQAVEAAAKPVILPKDDAATLGKMLRAVDDASHKWTFVLGEPEDAMAPASAMWKAHRRHGTDDREAPMGMSQEEADAAVHLALTLVRWFAGGAFRQAP
ncbi:MAG: hypothetical protein JHC95_15515 [Solirubrobacteraceae bacterium]|nr:hypothetical protein [Solirubrobacteraceae bacterium]